MQDHEVHRVAQIQMALHWINYSHTGDLVYWNPFVFFPELPFHETRKAILIGKIQDLETATCAGHSQWRNLILLILIFCKKT